MFGLIAAPVACLKASLSDLQSVLCYVSFPPAVRAAGVNHTNSLLVVMKAARQAGRSQPPPPSSRGTPLLLLLHKSKAFIACAPKPGINTTTRTVLRTHSHSWEDFFWNAVALKPADMDGIITFAESFFFLCHFLTNLFAGRCK